MNGTLTFILWIILDIIAFILGYWLGGDKIKSGVAAALAVGIFLAIIIIKGIMEELWEKLNSNKPK